jgi:microcystin-dependent protein
MSEPFMSEIRMISFNFPPKGWALANGQLLPINQNQALFSLLGTTYGGDGRVNFALPNLQGRVPISFGNGYTLGQTGGETAHTVSMQEMPQHLHMLQARQTPTSNAQLADTPSDGLFAPGQIGVQGGGSAPLNLSPHAANLVSTSTHAIIHV